MAWVWSDTLAALLIEHDRIDRIEVADWLLHPVAHRVPNGVDPLTLARRLLTQSPVGSNS